jgi:APA family basic amino acid/polyamine antiporter
MFIDSLSLVSAAATIFVFRRRAKADGATANNEIFQLRFYPWVPLLFMLVLLIVMFNVLVSDTQSALYGCIIFLAGYPLYWILRKVVSQ